MKNLSCVKDWLREGFVISIYKSLLISQFLGCLEEKLVNSFFKSIGTDSPAVLQTHFLFLLCICLDPIFQTLSQLSVATLLSSGQSDISRGERCWCYSMCGPQTSGVGATGECVVNAGAWAQSHMHGVRISVCQRSRSIRRMLQCENPDICHIHVCSLRLPAYATLGSFPFLAWCRQTAA